MQHHRWQHTRLPHPWDSPGKSTGVGCHFLLQCMKVKSESEVTQSCLTLRDPIDCSLPGSFIHGIFQAREYWSGLPLPSPSHLAALPKNYLQGKGRKKSSIKKIFFAKPTVQIPIPRTFLSIPIAWNTLSSALCLPALYSRPILHLNYLSTCVSLLIILMSAITHLVLNLYHWVTCFM